jgi:HEAT repeat protein
MGEPAIPALLLATRAPDWPVRAYAVDALGDIARPAPGVLPALIRALSDEAEWVRRHAADALGTIGPAAGDAAPALADTLRDEKPYVRINAATALAKLGPAAEPAIPALSAALRDDPDRYTRGFAAIALRRIGTDAAKDALLDALMISRWCPITTVESPY